MRAISSCAARRRAPRASVVRRHSRAAVPSPKSIGLLWSIECLPTAWQNAPLRAGSFVRAGNDCEQPVPIHEKWRAGLRQRARFSTPRGPQRASCARWGANGRARRSTDDEPERHFSGLRRAGSPARVLCALGCWSSFRARMNEPALSPVRPAHSSEAIPNPLRCTTFRSRCDSVLRRPSA